jgi:membrane-bound metal-dependent hydrolase YbcI (DUF457 family)
MRGRGHVGLGMCGISALSYYAGFPGVLPVACAVVGSLGPDIDGVGTIARPSKFLPQIFPKWLMDFVDWFGIHFSKLVKKVFGHRGMLHWPLIGLAMVGAGYQFHYPVLMWLGIGWLLHLVGDLITYEGIPLFAPLTSKKISLFPMRVGGTIEGAVGFLCWAIAIGLIAIQLFQIGGLKL